MMALHACIEGKVIMVALLAPVNFGMAAMMLDVMMNSCLMDVKSDTPERDLVTSGQLVSCSSYSLVSYRLSFCV